MRFFRALLVAAAATACGGQSAGVGSSPDAASDAPVPVEASPPDAGPGDGAVVTDAPSPSDASDAASDACPVGPPGLVPPPTFDPPPGTYGCEVPLTLASSIPDTTIYYTTNGTNPTSASQVYTGPISVGQTETIRAIAISSAPCIGPSPVGVGAYTIDSFPPPGAPSATPPAGTYHKAFTATLTQPAGMASVMCYTLNDTVASCSATCAATDGASCTGTSKTYDPAKPIAIDATVTDPKTGRVTLEPLGCKVACISARGTDVTYTLQVDPVAIAPTATTTVGASGTLAGVQITENGPAADEPYTSICWSTDGTTAPDCACTGATAADSAATVGPGLYVSKGNATPVMNVTKAQGATGITVRAVGCAAGYAPSDAPYASATWH